MKTKLLSLLSLTKAAYFGDAKAMGFKTKIGLIAAAMFAVFASAGPAIAAPAPAAVEPISVSDTAVLIDDQVTLVEASKPEVFAETVRAVEPYLVMSADGQLSLEVPTSVAQGLDAESYEALRSS